MLGLRPEPRPGALPSGTAYGESGGDSEPDAAASLPAPPNEMGPGAVLLAGVSAAAAPNKVRSEAPRGRPLVLAACLIGTFMAAIESTIVSTTLPTIVADLGGFELFSWVFTAFLLAQAVSIPLYGRLADMFGRKIVFFAGVGLFLTGAVLCGFAWGIVPLICFRALEGLGAGAIQPIAATILGDIYTPSERAHVQGLVSSVFGVSAVIGPSLGAFLIQHVSWPVVFWINVPIGLAAAAMIGIFLRETPQRRRHRIDWPGALHIDVLHDCENIVLYDPDHAICVEPQSGPPNGFSLDPNSARVAAGSSLERTVTWRWRLASAVD